LVETAALETVAVETAAAVISAAARMRREPEAVVDSDAPVDLGAGVVRTRAVLRHRKQQAVLRLVPFRRRRE
jgi:hypothetical protein